MLFKRHRAIRRASVRLMLLASAMAMSAMLIRESFSFIVCPWSPVRARRGVWLQAGPLVESMQQAPDDSLKIFSDIALPLLVIAGGLLARVLSDGKLQNYDPKVSVLTNRTTFADVPDHEGILEAKEELALVVDFLKNPEPFIKLGAQIPRKVLLSGPGDKELMAKALAGESGVPFLEVMPSASDSPVSDVFADAKGKAPCVLFIPLDKPCVDADCDLPDKTVPLPAWSGDRLDEVLNGMDDFKTSDIIFVASASKKDEVERLSSRFDTGVSVGYESDLVVGRRLLKANRLEEAVEAFFDACKGGKWRCGCSFCLAFSATDEMRAELSNAQELLEQHWEKYHDMRVALPSVVFPRAISPHAPERRLLRLQFVWRPGSRWSCVGCWRGPCELHQQKRSARAQERGKNGTLAQRESAGARFRNRHRWHSCCRRRCGCAFDR